jgi:CRP/FNR family cyclic AMP-dependent transcriptional regulator
MARDKQDRYAAVEDLARDIDEVMAGRWRPESRKEFEAGELLMKQGDPAREGYVILIGRVGVFSESDGKRVSLRECGPGEIVGEMALISNEPRSASVEALEDTSTAVITGERLAEHLKNLPPYIGKMVSILADRLRESSEMVHPLLTGDCTKAVIRQIRLLESAASEPASREEVERQVAGDLGLPIQRVREAVARALDEGLLSLDGAAIRVARRG